MKMSNKSAGTQFEREFASRLAAEGFWVHRFQDNKNGQPCDVIAARDGEAYLFDRYVQPEKGGRKPVQCNEAV